MIFPPKRVQIRNVQWKLLLLNYVGLKKKKKNYFNTIFMPRLNNVKSFYTYIYTYT